jgi:type I restriction enzyme, S subunit
MNKEMMQDSGVEWIGAIPQEWRLDRLKDMVSLRNEKSTEKSEAQDYLELEDLEQGTGRLLSIRSTANVESAVMKFYKGDVLFGKLRPYLRKYYLATFDGKCTGEILAFKPERIAPEFLLYFIASDGFIKICTAMSYGTKMPRVSYPKQLALLPVCLPSIEEQQAIARYLDQRCGKLYEIITIKQQQIKTLDALRQSIIYHAVTKGLDDSVTLVDSGVEWLGEIPIHWKTQQIKRLCELLRGKFSHRPRNDPAFYDGDYPFVQTGDITSADKCIKTYSQTLNELGFSVSKMFPRKTLVMSIAANVGDVAILDFDACFPDSMIGLIPDYHTNLDFLYYLMLAMKGILLRSAILTTQLNLNYVRIGTIYAPFPPISEQQAIADHLDQETQRLNDLKENLSQQISTLEAYKKALIYECVTGKKRINADVLKTS